MRACVQLCVCVHLIWNFRFNTWMPVKHTIDKIKRVLRVQSRSTGGVLWRSFFLLTVDFLSYVQTHTHTYTHSMWLLFNFFSLLLLLLLLVVMRKSLLSQNSLSSEWLLVSLLLVLPFSSINSCLGMFIFVFSLPRIRSSSELLSYLSLYLHSRSAFKYLSVRIHIPTHI